MATAQEKFDEAERLRTKKYAREALSLYIDVTADSSASEELKLAAWHMGGVAWRMHGNFERSEFWLETAMQLAVDAGAPEKKIAAIYSDLAETARQSGDLPQAKGNIRVALALDGTRYPAEVGIANGFLARIESTEGNFQPALRHHQLANVLLRWCDDRRPWLYNSLPYAETLSRCGHPLVARWVATRALIASPKLGSKEHAYKATAILVGGWRLTAFLSERRRQSGK